MTPFTMRARLALSLLLAIVLALPTASQLSAQQGSAGGGLSKYDRQLLLEARMAGAPTVTLMIAAVPGQNRAVADTVRRLGGSVAYREDDLSYIRAEVPTDQVEALAASGAVQSIDLDTVVPIEDPRPDPEGMRALVPYPPPDANTPKDNPYMPIGDIGAAQFLAANPAYDGRGVTVGIVDTGVSLDHPSLLTTSTGERKIVDWVTGTDPFRDNDPTWLNMQNQVTTSDGTFTYAYQNSTVVVNPGPPATKTYPTAVVTETFTAPYAGTFRIGIFNEHDARLGGETGRDINRDGNPAGTRGAFAVLWDTNTNTVYVDTNQNNSFADDMAMTDYKVRYDVNWFGTDNPATAVHEQMPFVVQTDGRNKVVNIGIVSGAHASHVAGITAGNSLFGGAMSGAAPGAQIVSLRACLFIAGCTQHALFEGMIFVAKQSDVDVINMSIGGLPALNDGNNTRATLYNRLIEQYNVQMFISAGNSGPGVNTVGDPSVASLVMSVGAYVSRATLEADYGTSSPYADNLHYFSSRGPREDGGFKPNVVAPGAAISSIPLWQPQGCLAQTCPVGYALFNGTSMAAPQATGAAALLISAAKQAGVQMQPAQLRQAMLSSARYLDPARFQAYDQGNGLIDVGAAWSLLQTNIKTVTIQSSVPVNTLLSGFLANPGYGAGIHDREGVTAGQSYTRVYTFVRTSGSGGTQRFNLSWVGNDGTFSTTAYIDLPKGAAVSLPVEINPAAAGAHAAILNLDDPATAGIDYQTMNTVIAADDFNAGNGYTVAKSGSVAPMNADHYFYRVPAGTPALKVDLAGPSSAPGTGQVRFLRWHPWGLGIDSNAVSNCYLPPVPGQSCNGATRTAANPQAGVWEVSVDARRTSDTDFAAYTLTTSILGASVEPDPDVIPSATLGTPVARSYTLTSLYAPFTGRAVGTALGSARLGVFSIAHHAMQVYDVNVIAGATALRATIGSPSDPGADLDLFVYQCSSPTSCALRGQSADGDSEESVNIANPAPGLWRVLIDAYNVPAGSTTYNYLDLMSHPSFGSIVVTDADALRGTGDQWTVPATVTANAAPAEDRVLYGNVEVRTDTNVLVGSGAVVIESVSP